MIASAKADAVPVKPPRSGADLDVQDFRNELRMLCRMRLLWVGLIVKVGCAAVFGSHFATRWFSPFVYEFVHSRFANPWERFLSRGEPLAFPYGPAMLAALTPAYLPAAFVNFDPSGHLGLLLLRLPLLLADLTILLLLMRWFRIQAREVVAIYWLSPIVLYATYIHGQLDLIPTALLCVALFFIFTRRTILAGLAFGLGLAAKAHLLIAFPFALTFLHRRRYPLRSWVVFGAVAALTTAAAYGPLLLSPAFRAMVLNSPETGRMWAVQLGYGASGVGLYLAPAVLFLAWFRFASFRRVNREVTIAFIGVAFIALIALVPAQPGWFIWFVPFTTYLATRAAHTARYLILVLSVAFLAHFFVSDPETFLEALDPLLGEGTGTALSANLRSNAPALISTHAASITLTCLFATTALAGIELYRRGVTANAIFRFSDETFMMGIGGDSGVGKHTLASDLQALLGDQLSIVHGDDDHKWERGHWMWGQHTHLDPRGNRLSSQLESLSALKRGHEIRKRHYDHDAGRFTEPIVLSPGSIAAIVGLHPFYLPSQRELLHLRIFLDPEEALRTSWKIGRDVAKRGYTPEQVVGQLDRRKEDARRYVAPQERFADIVLRHRSVTAAPEGVDLELEINNVLEPLALFELLSQAPRLEVDWLPDESLVRDRIRIRGDIGAEELRILSEAGVPDADELVASPLEGWRPGGRGVTQLVALSAISARMRLAGTSLG